MPDKAADQVWELTIDGRTHRVEARGSVSHQVRWYVDGALVAEKKSMDDKIRLAAEEQPELGELGVRFSGLGHGRRATVWPHDPDHASGPGPGAQAVTGIGGFDLDPEPGSRAAAYEARIRAHPRRYAATQTALGVAKVVVPIVIGLFLARLAFQLPLPDWDLPRPNLPDLPWPDLPSPNLPDVALPEWLWWVLDKLKYVGPVLIAIALAQREVKRRQNQDRLRDELRAKAGRDPGPAEPTARDEDADD